MVTIVGAGFAGVEAAWACAERGVAVRLYEMRPQATTPAHTTPWFAELVCSNSLKSKAPDSPAGQLKTEMAALGSLVLTKAAEHAVPGGQALAVDREKFSRAVTEAIEAHPLIEVVREEWRPPSLTLAPSGVLVLATGPLSTDHVSQWLAERTGRRHLHFYDAVSPTVDAATLDRDVVFAQSRYDKGEGDDYLNCPFDKDQYTAFVRALVAAERVPLHAFEAGGNRTAPTGQEPSPADQEGAFIEKVKYFAGCMPIEVIAEKGERSLAFGNFKPVGLTDPRTGRRPYAALQLRPENREKTLYSLVACQNRLRFGEQKRVFQMVPGLENAEFVRYGVIHRNTYIDAPRVLTPWLELRETPGVLVTGQLTGVEGYVESAAMGIWAGLVASARAKGQEVEPPPRATALGSLLAHLQDTTERDFAPMNINWGLFPELEPQVKDKASRRALKVRLARDAAQAWMAVP
ncbi:MAG: methylenetetrahydrofolate--tRNA-(uracil(54)-C(5))-methyltransferase (FADH(2)-oxidizing) TrmFO [Fimbriimonadaceae bacterium]|nr:methylenetetrahydrofolate--tRNA-(uracil(54)-C(5))-methyltransferase (FADH(2)-oxidizing) TrmFO [Fimbriimonadaceae bacterium]QYK54892.1 MAG: methylenetetrahydrofolate--tRNA-(uracil(54)-C(5))-methyltransferase (FADH(2)-oxidizing) TrmFO [Fimbriimonadaceae bacterium]